MPMIRVVSPGHFPRKVEPEVSSMLTLLEDFFVDANIALELFEQSAVAVQADFQEMADRGLRNAHPSTAAPYDPEHGRRSRILSRTMSLHAHSVLYSLEGFLRCLNQLVQLRPDVAALKAMEKYLTESFPALGEVRNSAHHNEERTLGIGKNRRPLPTTILNLGSLRGDALEYTLHDGTVGSVRIHDSTVLTFCEALACIQRGFDWTGDERLVP